MKATSETSVRLGFLQGTDVIAEVAKMAAKLEYEMHLRPDDEVDGAHAAELWHTEPVWLADEIAYLVFVQALASGASPLDVLEAARTKLQQMHATMNLPPLDAPGIGELHPGGHDDHA